MTVSIIIVNYNVKYFLEQCLHSVKRGSEGLEVEVIVVDNCSADDSLAYLQPRFPDVRFISNRSNLGFSRACNLGLQEARGAYILFLNPDTLLAEDTLHACIGFFEQRADAGAVGVRMIDGSGKFLKESKRAFPAPLTSLFKLFGLSRIFPHSRLFSRYHLGHLDAREDHEVDVLAGAFILVRKTVLDAVGAFDEAFFMYGEDVDLSYRIQKGGYKNYYLARTEIIHFKGESTKRGSLNYVRMFYSAMSTFVKKHYGGTRATFFNAAIHFAIAVRAVLSALAKLIRWMGLPAIDAVLILAAFWLVKELWTLVVKPDYKYPDQLLLIAFPAFTLVYLVVAYYTGLYDRQYNRSHLVRSPFIATLVLLALYALLPEQYRFSRGIVVFGAILAFAFTSLLRRLLARAAIWQQPVPQLAKPYILVGGTHPEYAEVQQLLQPRGLDKKLIGYLSVDGQPGTAIAQLGEADKIVPALNAQELILCIGRLTCKSSIAFIQHLHPPVRIRFHTAGSSSIVGSDSHAASGAVISSETDFNLAQPTYRRLKRLVDMAAVLLFLLSFPLHLLLVRHPLSFYSNLLAVCLGKKTWIGYITRAAHLPPLRPAVLASNGLPPRAARQLTSENVDLVDFWYAQNYEPLQDLSLIVKNYRRLGFK